MEDYRRIETKEQKFKRIASKRTEKILDALRKLGNCSNTAVYSYSDEDISKIFAAIETELRRIKILYSRKSKTSKFNL